MNCPNFTHLLVLPHLRVHNANAVSSPLTHGFPSITAFLGLMWALERKTRALAMDVEFCAVGAICHDHQEQATEDGFVKNFRLTRNPVARDGNTAAIVEEGRIHLELSLVLAVNAGPWDQDAQQRDLHTIVGLLQGMRIAGGAPLPMARLPVSRHRPWLSDFTGSGDDQEREFRKLCARLLPGTALVARDDLLEKRLQALRANSPNATRLDAWFSLSRINWHTWTPPIAEHRFWFWITGRDCSHTSGLCLRRVAAGPDGISWSAPDHFSGLTKSRANSRLCQPRSYL